jgi:sialic acid synthase SpsE
MKDTDLIDSIYSEHKQVFKSGHNVYVKSEYPAYPYSLVIPKQFVGALTGYSDHTHGIEACLLAVSRGASYIEKHVCLDKSDLVTKDTPFSATPDEFAEMVRIGNGMRRLLDAGA